MDWMVIIPELALEFAGAVSLAAIAVQSDAKDTVSWWYVSKMTVFLTQLLLCAWGLIVLDWVN